MKRIVLFTFLVITLSFNSLFAGITISGQVTKAEIKNLPNGDSELTITCSGEGICVSIYPGSDGEILISIPDLDIVDIPIRAESMDYNMDQGSQVEFPNGTYQFEISN